MSWQYEPAADLDQPLAERLRRFPREPDMTVYGLRSLAALTVRRWLRLYHRLEISGIEHLPKEGSFVMVANHSSHLDTLCLLSTLPLTKLHRAFPAAAQDFFFVSVPRLALAAVVVNALPFGRRAHIRQSLDLCRHLLSNPGNILILFPEGTRTPDGQLQSPKPGVGFIVCRSQVPVIPARIFGSFEAYGKGRKLPRLGTPVSVVFGKPLLPADYDAPDAGKDRYQVASNRIMAAIAKLAQPQPVIV